MAPLPVRDDIVYGSTKSYVATTSTAFRQHNAKSHCAQLHGYALTFKATFEATNLDSNNWVVDFGGLKSFKGWLDEMFDHTTLVAQDDPHRLLLKDAHNVEVLDIRVVTATGCEAIARICFDMLEAWLRGNGYSPRVQLVKFEVSEHQGNSAYVRLKQSMRRNNE